MSEPREQAQPPTHVSIIRIGDIINILEEPKVPKEIRQDFWALISKTVPTTYIDNPRCFAAWAEHIIDLTLMSVPQHAIGFEWLAQMENLKFHVNIQLLKAKEGFLWRALKPAEHVRRSFLQRLLGGLGGR